MRPERSNIHTLKTHTHTHSHTHSNTHTHTHTHSSQQQSTHHKKKTPNPNVCCFACPPAPLLNADAPFLSSLPSFSAPKIPSKKVVGAREEKTAVRTTHRTNQVNANLPSRSNGIPLIQNATLPSLSLHNLHGLDLLCPGSTSLPSGLIRPSRVRATREGPCSA